jgi:hypothetical protein
MVQDEEIRYKNLAPQSRGRAAKVTKVPVSVLCLLIF